MVQLIISPPFALCLQVLCTEVLFMPFHFSWPYAKGCLWAGAPDHFLHIGLLKPTLSFWRIYTPGYYFSNEGPKATCGKRRRRAVARSEQHAGVNNIPKGLTCIHTELCLRFAQRTWARQAPFKQVWWSNRDPWALGSCFEFISFDFSCIDLWGPALFNIQIQDFMITHVICTPGHDISRESFQNKRLQFLVIFGMQGCFICRYFVSGPNPLQSF